LFIFFFFSSAVTRKNQALIALRKIKAAQLDNSNTNRKINEDSSSSLVLLALQEYENALKQEMQLRTILPGIRLIAPNDSRQNQEDVAAAALFLGWNTTMWDSIDGSSSNNTLSSSSLKQIVEQKMRDDLQPLQKRQELLIQSRRRFDDSKVVMKNSDDTTQSSLQQQKQHHRQQDSSDKERIGMSPSARVVLLSIAFVQVLLVIFLSLDPDVAKELFKLLENSDWSLE